MEAKENHVILIWYAMESFLKKVIFKLKPLRDEKLAR